MNTIEKMVCDNVLLRAGISRMHISIYVKEWLKEELETIQKELNK